ncbi:hypothetical protein GCM10023149_04990 [Mucilaginibacter gynuensis]|uniref:Uncharacterized protein n=2 Tax=Mucilaginibacter gynuensis TaxID=1302236 RepID=A0ABP8FSZ9_9SPHI
MVEYKVSNLTDTVIYGAIDNQQNTITVYVPFYYNLSIIDPLIKVEDGAKLKDEILPVELGSTSQTYTVIGADGSQKVYKLIIVEQNTPSLELIYNDPSNLVTYPLGTLPIIRGNLFSRNPQNLNVSLVAKSSSKVIPLDNSTAQIFLSTDDGLYTMQYINIPADADTGYFDVNVKFLGHDVKLGQPVHIIHRQPYVTTPSVTVKQGDNLTYNAYQSLLLNLKSVKATLGGKVYDFAIVSSNALSVTIKVPDDFPVGVYTAFADRPRITFEFEGWAPHVGTQAMTVTAK